jgi:hypothetical protein
MIGDRQSDQYRRQMRGAPFAGSGVLIDAASGRKPRDPQDRPHRFDALQMRLPRDHDCKDAGRFPLVEELE